MLIVLAMMQVATAAAPPPDIELVVHAEVRSVEIERKGVARLEVRAEPDGGSLVDAQIAPEPEGRTSLRNIRIDVHGEARIADPQQNSEAVATEDPESR